MAKCRGGGVQVSFARRPFPADGSKSDSSPVPALDLPTCLQSISVDELESLPMHTLRGSSFYTLEILERHEDWSLGLRVEKEEKKVVLDWIEVA